MMNLMKGKASLLVATVVLGGLLVNISSVQADDGTSTSNLNQAAKANNQPVMSTSSASSSIKNGWQHNSDQTWTYYTNGQVKAGRDYAKLPTINGNGENWYLVDNGQAQSQIQSWAGSFWYFDPNTYLLSQKRQLISEWGNQYVVGEDGRIQSGVQQVNGKIYDMDSNTYTFSKRRAYDKANNGNWYLVDHGYAQSGVQAWAGSYWYFDPNTYLLKAKKDYIKSQWGMWYLVGNDGRIQSGVQEWSGSYWYFDPNTYLLRTKKDYIKSQWGLWYLVGNDGRIQSGVQEWAGSYWYFDPYTYLLRTKKDYIKSQWGDWYLVGDDGRIQSGLQEWAGALWYFDPNSYLLGKNQDVVANGYVYHVDATGRASLNFPSRIVKWFKDRFGKLTYSMRHSRDGSDGTADCSGAVTAAMIAAGAKGATDVYDTNSIPPFLLANGYQLVYEGSQFMMPKYGDIVIWGKRYQEPEGGAHMGIVSSLGNNPNFISVNWLSKGKPGMAVSDDNYAWYWNNHGKKYSYIYRYVGKN